MAPMVTMFAATTSAIASDVRDERVTARRETDRVRDRGRGKYVKTEPPTDEPASLLLFARRDIHPKKVLESASDGNCRRLDRGRSCCGDGSSRAPRR